MLREIESHQKYMADKISEGTKDSNIKSLLRYHNRRVRDFQHERLIHLLVTFFFAFLLLVSLAFLLFTPLPELFWPLTALCLILLVLEIAYIWHYYQLENGVQSLYELTDQLSRR